MSDDPRWGDDRGTVETTTGATVTTKTRLRWVVVRVQPLRETTTPTMTRGIVTMIDLAIDRLWNQLEAEKADG